MPMRATGARPHRTCPHGSRERWTSSAWRNSAHLPYAAGLRPTSRQRQHSLPHPTALSRAQLDSPLRPTREFPYDTRPPSQAGAPTRRASPPCTCGPHLPSLGPREGQSPRPQILPGVNAYPKRSPPPLTPPEAKVPHSAILAPRSRMTARCGGHCVARTGVTASQPGTVESLIAGAHAATANRWDGLSARRAAPPAEECRLPNDPTGRVRAPGGPKPPYHGGNRTASEWLCGGRCARTLRFVL